MTNSIFLKPPIANNITPAVLKVFSFVTMTPPTHSNHHAEAQQNIDNQIAQLEAQIVSLKVARNALTPVSRLHPEILQEILIMSSRDSGKAWNVLGISYMETTSPSDIRSLDIHRFSARGMDQNRSLSHKQS